MLRVAGFAGVCALAIFASAPAAHGARLSFTGSEGGANSYTYFDYAGEQNRLTVTRVSDGGSATFIFEDPGGRLDMNPNTAAVCVVESPTRARCNDDSVLTLDILLNAGDDTATLEITRDTGVPPNGDLDGGSGNDVLTGSEGGADHLRGGAGDDTLNGRGESDNYDGGDGNDTIAAVDGPGIGFEDPEAIICGTGTDTVAANPHDNVQPDCETVTRSGPAPKPDEVRRGGEGGGGKPGAERAPDAGAGCNADPRRGDAGNDSLRGGADADHLQGLGGADRLFGLGGSDCLRGGDGPDRLFGGAGDDVAEGGEGRDRIFGEGGDDELSGGVGDDRISGGRGRDSITGGAGNDAISAADGGRDTVDCGAGSKDRVVADAQDRLTGCEKVTRR